MSQSVSYQPLKSISPRFGGSIEKVDDLISPILEKPDVLYSDYYVKRVHPNRPGVFLEDAILRQLTDLSHRENLFLMGLPGTGKTCLIRKIERDLARQNIPTYTTIGIMREMDQIKAFLKDNADKPRVILFWEEIGFPAQLPGLLGPPLQEIINDPNAKNLIIVGEAHPGLIPPRDAEDQKVFDAAFPPEKRILLSVLSKKGSLQLIANILGHGNFQGFTPAIQRKVAKTLKPTPTDTVRTYITDIMTAFRKWNEDHGITRTDNDESETIPEEVFIKAFTPPTEQTETQA